MSQYFPKPYEPFGGDINVKVDLSNYATKTDFKKATGIDTSKLAAKFDLASLKAELHKIDIDKLNTVPVDLSKLSNVVNNEVVKKTVYGKLVAKVNAIDTSGFVLKTKYDTCKLDLEKKICDEIEGKIPSISGLATNFVLITVENKIPDISNLVKKKQQQILM